MALRSFSMTVPRGQEYLLPFPTARRQSTGGLSRAARLAFDKALQQFQPGGAFGKGVESMLERGRKKSTARGQQALASAGLAGTSMMAAPGQKFEEEVATPTRLRAEETRVGRLSELYAMLAQMEQSGFESALRSQSTPRFVNYSGSVGAGGGYVSPVDFSIAG